MSKKANIGPHDISKCNGAIGKWLTPILPPKNLYPGTNITFHIRTLGEQVPPVVEFAVKIAQPLKEFEKLVFGKETEIVTTKTDRVLLIGDERVPGGVYILYSALVKQMLCMKFATEVEAISYINHFGDSESFPAIMSYTPIRIKSAVAEDKWFDGVPTRPDIVGFRAVDSKTVEVSTYGKNA